MAKDANYEIFVSYSRKDYKLVTPVVRLLRATKGLIFQDIDDIEGGKKWRKQIDAALENAHLIVVFWCSHSDSSHEVRREYQAAIRADKDLLPVLLDDTPLPDDLGEFHGVDFRGVAAHDDLYLNEVRESPRRKLWWGATIIAVSALAAVFSSFLFVARPTLNSPRPRPEVVSFNANPSSLASEGSVLLSWSTKNTTSVEVLPEVGRVANSGSIVITVRDPITYTLIARGAGETHFRHLGITVAGNPPIPGPMPDSMVVQTPAMDAPAIFPLATIVILLCIAAGSILVVRWLAIQSARRIRRYLRDRRFAKALGKVVVNRVSGASPTHRE